MTSLFSTGWVKGQVLSPPPSLLSWSSFPCPARVPPQPRSFLCLMSAFPSPYLHVGPAPDCLPTSSSISSKWSQILASALYSSGIHVSLVQPRQRENCPGQGGPGEAGFLQACGPGGRTWRMLSAGSGHGKARRVWAGLAYRVGHGVLIVTLTAPQAL